MLEKVIGVVEEFMGVPFPKSYVALVVADATRHAGGGGPSGIITVAPGLKGEVGLVAHEASHIYWAQPPVWLREGVAKLLGVITESALSGEPVGSYRASCSLADNLGDLDRLESDDVSAEDASSLFRCPYSLGLGLYLDLYHTLGLEAFQRGFGSLYLKLEAQEHSECVGLEGVFAT